CLTLPQRCSTRLPTAFSFSPPRAQICSSLSLPRQVSMRDASCRSFSVEYCKNILSSAASTFLTPLSAGRLFSGGSPIRSGFFRRPALRPAFLRDPCARLAGLAQSDRDRLLAFRDPFLPSRFQLAALVLAHHLSDLAAALR